jgi:N6-L-threonylcarbamoyladenine synthase
VTFLLNKLTKATEQTGIKEVAIAGGVSANSELRGTLSKIGKEKGWNTYIPSFDFCTDNAAMIAVTGYQKYLKGEFVGQDIAPTARYRI